MDCPFHAAMFQLLCSANHGSAAGGPIGWGVLPPGWVSVMRSGQVRSGQPSGEWLSDGSVLTIVASPATWSVVRPAETSGHRLWCQVSDPWLNMRIHILSRTLRLAEVNPCGIIPQTPADIEQLATVIRRAMLPSLAHRNRSRLRQDS